MSKSEYLINKYTESMRSRLTLEEKVKALCGAPSPKVFKERYEKSNYVYNSIPYASGSIEQEQITPVNFVDGTRGVVCGQSTCFPVSLARGATFDRDLEYRVGQVMAEEALVYGGNLLGSVCINIIRHLQGGRSQESYGEDMYLLGSMGSALVEGIQSKGVMACVKHFACNNIENTRAQVNVNIDDRTLHEIYLPHFKKCVDAGAAAFMGAYNKVNGKYCCENKELLTKILRDMWGFKGFVLSDFIFAIHDAAKAINAGLDLEMPISLYYKNSLKSDVREGLVLEKTIDQAFTRLVKTSLSFAEDRDIHTLKKPACEEHVAIAEETAEKAMVLLKNKKSVLPLKTKDQVAVFGSLATEHNLGDKGSSYVKPPFSYSIMDGIQEYADAHNCNVVCVDDTENEKHMKSIAKKSDKVIVVVGTTSLDEGERFERNGGDRESIRLKEHEIKLIKQLAEVQDRIIVIAYGCGFIFTEIEDKVEAIIMAWYPGMVGGRALGKLLYGEINFSGKLPVSLPRHEQHMTSFNNKELQVDYDYYHGYMLLDQLKEEAAYAFGFGLSYTQFKLNQIQVDYNSFYKRIDVTLQVKNTGKVKGREVIQVYGGSSGGTVDKPEKVLLDFKPVQLEAGESTHIAFTLDSAVLLNFFDSQMGAFNVDQEINKLNIYVGTSSSKKDLSKVTINL